MNLFLHGIEDFHIAHGDTLAEPASSTATAGCRLRRGPRQSAVLHQAVEPRRLRQGPLGPQHLGHAAAGPRRLRLLPAHRQEPGPEDRPLRDPFPHGVLFRKKKPRCAKRWSKSDLLECVLGLGAEPVLQLADGSVRRHPAAPASRRPQGQGAVHQRRQRGRPRAGTVVPARDTRTRSSPPTAASPTTTGSPRSRRWTRSLQRATPSRSRCTSPAPPSASTDERV